MNYKKMGKTLKQSSAKAWMDEKTARKYLKAGKLPSQLKQPHRWRTRKDAFEDVWEELKEKLEVNPGLESQTLFDYLQRKYPGKFQDGQVRTLQRRIKEWRAKEGPSKEVYFPQIHKPGQLCQSDFTHMTSLGVTIAGQRFVHLVYHFVLTYSNWESASVCFSESYESLSSGLQNALWDLGKVPYAHQIDCMSTAVKKPGSEEEFTRRYQGFVSYYAFKARKINPGKAHENGDVEQRHYRFKKAVDQALMLRGSRDFESRKEYETFLKHLLTQLNQGRQKRLVEELNVMKSLPKRRLEDCKRQRVKVGPSSTIHVAHNTYSVHSRLIGEKVEVRLYAERLEVWYAQKKVDTIPRLRGEGRHHIEYRHIIDWLVRKPGAFENYLYRSDLFPSTRFRMAYDILMQQSPTTGHKQYLKILHLAALENEERVDDALRLLIDMHRLITLDAVKEIVESEDKIPPVTQVEIEKVDPRIYDQLLEVVV